MLRQTHQKSIFNEIDQPKSSARSRCRSSNNQFSNSQFKSVKKQSSNKYLRPFSPKKFKNNHKSNQKQNISKTDSNDKNTHEKNDNCIIQNDDCLPSHRALRILDSNINTSRQNIKSHPKNNINSQKPIKNQQSLIERFQQNESKIILMRQQLERVFQTFKLKQKELKEMKSELKNRDKINVQNEFLSKQIARVQEMIKQALLEREKLKHGSLMKRINR